MDFIFSIPASQFHLVAQPDQLGYKFLVWFLSTSSSPPVLSDIVETDWFNFSATIVLPILALGIALNCAFWLWSGLAWALQWTSDR